MLKNMNEQSKHFRNCLIEILLLLCECVNTKMEEFLNLVKHPKDDTISLSQNKGRKRGEDADPAISQLVNSTQEYNCLIDEILVILRGVDGAFKVVNTKVQDILENNKKSFLDSLNNIYTIE
jgi:hypothetical protein